MKNNLKVDIKNDESTCFCLNMVLNTFNIFITGANNDKLEGKCKKKMLKSFSCGNKILILYE